MSSYAKGKASREMLLIESKNAFNELGLNLTLGNLASTINITLGRLTYHFPTKDHLFVAIAADYQLKVDALIHEIEGEFDLSVLFDLTSRIMDLQYDYRSAIRYVLSVVRNQSELFNHVLASYKADYETIRQMLHLLIDNEELKPEILEDQNFKVFMFTYLNLLTTWLASLEIYDSNKSYPEVKLLYLQGVFSTMKPYLTDKGNTVLDQKLSR